MLRTASRIEPACGQVGSRRHNSSSLVCVWRFLYFATSIALSCGVASFVFASQLTAVLAASLRCYGCGPGWRGSGFDVSMHRSLAGAPKPEQSGRSGLVPGWLRDGSRFRHREGPQIEALPPQATFPRPRPRPPPPPAPLPRPEVHSHEDSERIVEDALLSIFGTGAGEAHDAVSPRTSAAGPATTCSEAAERRSTPTTGRNDAAEPCGQGWTWMGKGRPGNHQA